MYHFIYRGKGRRGISHYDEIDLRRHRLPIHAEGHSAEDITELYLAIAAELKEMGF